MTSLKATQRRRLYTNGGLVRRHHEFIELIVFAFASKIKFVHERREFVNALRNILFALSEHHV